MTDAQARYLNQGEGIEVFDPCRLADGAISEITGVAKVIVGSGHAKLRVGFSGPPR